MRGIVGAQTFKILIMEPAHKLLGSGEIESFRNLQPETCNLLGRKHFHHLVFVEFTNGNFSSFNTDQIVGK